ncbi:hypothetical protein V2E39_16870 [Chryseobacterium arthrosphaerae]|uniref:Uncharacterized protein n=1 Tax=Chryseobacterium arthrosphaerae TaxID=651561 RepID=A0ABU7R366_9FLAO|nr:hypothetical protein [Chryseobacterium arthrosphaerae]AYZ12888.1 hypothetical protein EGY05_13560 [Chryseobacterium arthrosphaerae]
MLQEVSQETKDALKKEHGDKLKSLILPLDDDSTEEIEVLAIVPSRSVVGQSMKFMNSDPKKGQEILVKNCLITDKERVLNDDGLFYAAAGLISELIPIRQGKFGKV